MQSASGKCIIYVYPIFAQQARTNHWYKYGDRMYHFVVLSTSFGYHKCRNSRSQSEQILNVFSIYIVHGRKRVLPFFFFLNRIWKMPSWLTFSRKITAFKKSGTGLLAENKHSQRNSSYMNSSLSKNVCALKFKCVSQKRGHVCVMSRLSSRKRGYPSHMGPFVVHRNYVISCDGAKVPSWGSDF